ncbi:MAG: signal recognition particle protein [Rhabdochlamydiaceae bacterium]
MFDALTQKFQNLFSSLSAQKTLTADNISEAVKEVRLALLDADVSYAIASQLVKKIKEKSLGIAITKSVSPSEQFIKIVHDELVHLMGDEETELNLRSSLSVILMCGLQGSGKTTQSAKLAFYIKKKYPHKKVLLAACDLNRFAAIEQLRVLGESAGVPVFTSDHKEAVKVAEQAFEEAKKQQYDVLIIDTAGRLHVEDSLMKELLAIKTLLSPQEILFVANAATGQEAVNIAQAFDQQIGVTGTILTMLDGTTRAGAAISIKEVTKKPLKFEGIGEKIQDLRPFNPRSMADRILGMGDVINLVRQAEDHFDEKEKADLKRKLRTAAFTYDDYLKQMGKIKKMGSLGSLLKMVPGISNHVPNFDLPEKEFKNLEAMILSMTPDERAELVELQPSRRRRIALGSGTNIDEVNKMVKNFKKVKQMAKDLPNLKKQFAKMNFFN